MADSAEESLLYVAVLQILRLRFHGVQASAAETLTDVLQNCTSSARRADWRRRAAPSFLLLPLRAAAVRKPLRFPARKKACFLCPMYCPLSCANCAVSRAVPPSDIMEIGALAKSFAEHAGRTMVNLNDLESAFEDMGIKAGDLASHVNTIPENPFVRTVPPLPIARPNMLGTNAPTLEAKDLHKVPPSVPKYLPKFPDTHTYKQGAVWEERHIAERQVKRLKSSNRREVGVTLSELNDREEMLERRGTADGTAAAIDDPLRALTGGAGTSAAGAADATGAADTRGYGSLRDEPIGQRPDRLVSVVGSDSFDPSVATPHPTGAVSSGATTMDRSDGRVPVSFPLRRMPAPRLKPRPLPQRTNITRMSGEVTGDRLQRNKRSLNQHELSLQQRESHRAEDESADVSASAAMEDD